MAKTWTLVRSYAQNDTHWYVRIANVKRIWLFLDNIFNSSTMGKLCCGWNTAWILHRPIHCVLNKVGEKTWIGEEIRVSDDVALKLDPKWVAEVLQCEEEDIEEDSKLQELDL